MTPFEKQQIRTLVWKEWRQVRAVIFMAVGIILFSLLMIPLNNWNWYEALNIGGAIALLLLSFGLGVVPYGMELNDHTNAYLFTRPVEHWKVFVVKLLWSLIPVWILANIQLAIPTLRGGMDLDGFWTIELFPLVVLTIQFFILLIPPMVPALIISIGAGLAALWILKTAPSPWLICICGLLVLGSYALAGRRMRGQGW